MKLVFPLAAATVLCGLASAPDLAAAPLGTAFTYQGRLQSGAAPANGQYDLSFGLHFSAAGGGPVAALTNSNVSVSNGLFTTSVGFGPGLLTSGQAFWLELGVRTNGSAGAFTTLSPRQPLTPAPYAQYAPTADFAFAAGIASTASQAYSVLNGAISPSQLHTTAAPTPGQVLSYDGSSLAWTDPTGSGPSATNVWNTSGNAGTSPANGNYLGTSDNQPLELRVNGVRALRLEWARFGLPNVIGGSDSTVATFGSAIGGGYGNTIHTNANYSFIGAGCGNTIQPSAASSTIGGGYQNTIGTNAINSFIGGGNLNTIQHDAFFSSVAGGLGNAVGPNAFAAAIGGGNYNTIQTNSFYCTIPGGNYNLIQPDAFYSTIGGGAYNTNGGSASVVPGGMLNAALGDYSFAAGQKAKARDTGAFVWADSQYDDFTSSGANQFLVRAAGGVGINKNNPATALDVNGTVMATAFQGNGSAITNLNASSLASGTIALARLPGAVVTNNETGVSLAGSFSGNLLGSATSATNFSGALAGDVTGTQSATVVSSVGGQSAANVASGVSAANAATSANTASTIVKRDASGNLSAGSITLDGSLTLPATTTAADTIYSGSSTLLRADNSQNFFVGVGAGNVAMSGTYNSGAGYMALHNNTSANYNTANGAEALQSNTTGEGNTANGAQALHSNTTGDANTASGNWALYYNTNGIANTANGYYALNENTAGSYNVAEGLQALRHNTIGTDNTAIGTLALINNTVGSGNIALGDGAGASVYVGSNNIFIGNLGVASDNNIIRIGSIQTSTYIAGAINGNGSGLTNLNAAKMTGTFTGNVNGSASTATNFFGFLLGDVTGTQGATVVGKVGGQAAVNVANATTTVLNANAVNVANTLVKRDASGNFHAGSITVDSIEGVGSLLTSLNASSLSSGTVSDQRLSSNVPRLNISQTFVGQNTFNGAVTLGNTLRLLDKPIYFRVGTDLAHGLGWFSTGTFAGSNPDGPVLWGNGGGGLGTVNTSTNLALIWNSSGRVGIGRSPTANALEVAGNASKDVAGSWVANSDARIKTDIATVTNALETLRKVRLVSFRYDDQYRATHPAVADRRYLNVLAQEFQKVFPDHVQGSGERLPDGQEILQVDPWPLTIYSAAAVQELSRQLEEKGAEIQALKHQNESLAERLNSLERLVKSAAARH